MAGSPGIRIGGFERTFRDDEARAQILTKANSADVYTKAEADIILNDKADASTTYTKTEVDTKVGAKADATTAVTHTASTAVGSGTQPVYINSSGVATATTYSLAKSVPSDAKFTDTTYSDATTSAHGLMTAADKTKLNGIATSANNYSHPTTSGNKHIPSGGSSGQILRWSADGTATWGSDNNTTYSDATTSAHGLMSAADKTKLNAVSDYITSSGTSGIWNYTKWNSGIATCSCFVDSSTVSSTGTQGSSYLSPQLSVNFPFSFTARPHYSISGGLDYSATGIGYTNVQTNKLTFIIVSDGVSFSNQKYHYAIFVEGRWK